MGRWCSVWWWCCPCLGPNNSRSLRRRRLPRPSRRRPKIVALAQRARLRECREGHDTTHRIGRSDLLRDGQPEIEGFNVACYHTDVNAFMARGCELRPKE